MVRYQVILAYDGTEFCGFQRQANGRSVQEAVEQALRQLGWQGGSILGAGRTDSGVHASGQVIAFDLDWRHSPPELQAALNSLLPDDLSAQSVRPARDDFHPRYDALFRRYQYRMYCQAQRNPLLERYAWRVWPEVALDRLRQAATLLVGRHDFAAFGTSPRTGGSTVRTVLRADWQPQGSEIIFEIAANAFLYRMVRRLVAAQVAVAQDLLPLEGLARCLEGPQDRMVQGLAPAYGLTLVEVAYPPQVEG